MSSSKSSKNALSHGAYSSEVIFPWENAQEFHDLHQDLREEHSVNGRSEEEEVAELASLHWKKRRLKVMSQIAACRDVQLSQLEDAGRRDGWSGIIDYIANMPDDWAAPIREMINYHCKMMLSASARAAKEQLEAGAPGQTVEQKTIDKVEDSTKSLEKLKALGAPIGPLLRILEIDPLEDKRSPYRASIMEKELKIGADIDKRIDKVMRRLVSIKEYKKLYGPKEISALQPQAKILPAPPEQIQ